MSRWILAALLAVGSAGAPAATFTVTTVFDDTFSNDSNPGDGICVDSFPGSTDCTLRAAIQEANALAGPDRIEFSVAGVIAPDTNNLGPLPFITEDLVVDGTGAPGWAPLDPVVYLEGTGVEAGTSPFSAGLEVTAGSLDVFGLRIGAFPFAGIKFDNGAAGGSVDGCVLGLDENGNSANHPKSLSTTGIRLNGQGAVIGTSLGNVISGNRLDGIQILGADNTIARNIIGMDRTGLVDRGNRGRGIYIFDFAEGNLIGGSDADAGNHFANNDRGSILVDGTNNVIEGNTVGYVPGTGVFFSSITTAIEVAGDGHTIGGDVGNRIIDRNSGIDPVIRLGATLGSQERPATNVLVTGNQIGTETVSLGSRAGIQITLDGSTGNTIAANWINNAGFGVEITSDGNTVTQNQLGIDPQLGLGNRWGIVVSSANNQITENTIGNSQFEGMLLSGDLNVVFANDIGFAAGIGAVGNGRGGIEIRSGTEMTIQANRILNNGGPGVAMRDSGSVEGITIVGNSMQFNDGIGIDILEFDGGFVPGPTPNDPGDPDSGGNRKMNHPEFAEAVPINGTNPVQTVVTFLVDSDPANQAYPITVDFYRTDAYGEYSGVAFLDSAVFDTFGAEESITLTLPAGIGIDDHFTAVATDADGNTSEFAPARSLGEVLFRDGYEI